MNTSIAGTKILPADQTKSGYISLWESGGGLTNTGHARIIAKPDGSKPKATYIRRKGILSCAEHAMIPIHKGYWVIDAAHHRGNFTISVMQITESKKQKNNISVAVLEIYELANGKWNTPLPCDLEAAVEAAKSKALIYHCRTAVFAVQKEKEELN